MLTDAYAVALVAWKYIVRGLALVGFLALVAMASYFHKEAPQKVALSGNCINSACDQPCPVKPTRFKRHVGDCQ